MTRKLVAGAIAAAFATASIVATPVFADSDLPNVRPHRHYIVTPTGAEVEVGPAVCDNANLQGAFNQFHFNVHVDADGLHDHKVAIKSGRC